MGRKSGKSGVSSEERGAGEEQQHVKLRGPGTFSLEVVGESHYQEALEEICGGRTEDGENLIIDAILIHQNNNQHDAMAVAVAIKGELVGYLSRENARQYRQSLKDSGFAGYPAVCRAKITGGWDRGDGNVGHFGVRLDLPTT
jgi:hypothetical protein